MKKTLVLAAAAFAALVVTGCVSVNTSEGATQVPQVKSCHPGYAAKFTHKDVRVSGSAQINVLFNLFAWGTEGFADNSSLSSFSFLPSPGNLAKSAAVYNTCQASKSDVLVGTRYTMTTTDYFVFKTIKCEVSGYPATMTGVVEKKPYIANGNLLWLAEKPTVIK